VCSSVGRVGRYLSMVPISTGIKGCLFSSSGKLVL